MATSNQNTIIADTSGLVSLFSPGDQNHEKAVAAAEFLSREYKDILVPGSVFVELLNVLGRKSGHKTALAAAAELTPPFLIINEQKNLSITPALAKFKSVPQAVSFTDCLVMAVADHYGTKDIFGFDKQFEDAGYHRITPSAEWKDTA